MPLIIPTVFESTLTFGQKVIVDGDDSIKAIVTAFCFRIERAPTVEISWFHNGEPKCVWVEQSRLSPA